MVERDDGVGARLGDVVEAGDLEPVEARGRSPTAGRASALVGMVRADRRRRRRGWRRRSPRNSALMRDAVFLQHRDADARHVMKAALSTFTAATTRARRSGAGPGLHRRERRHDEEAAADARGRRDRWRREGPGRARRPRATPRPCAAAAMPPVSQPRSSANRPSSTAPKHRGNAARCGRWRARRRGPSPRAIATENTAR